MNYINLGIFAHTDAGKTTVVERLLYLSGMIQKPGKVDDGSATTDNLAIERERGISVRCASAAISLPGLQINLIDTPGHMDFTSEVERAFFAVDAAVLVVSAAEGIQPQTELIWEAIRKAQIPAIIFLNKMDRTGVRPERVLHEMKQKFSSYIVAVNAYAKEGGRDCIVFPADFTEDDILSICSCDDNLGEALLTGKALRRDDLLAGVQKLMSSGIIFPLIYGAAALNLGIQDLFDFIKSLPKTAEEPGGSPEGIVYKLEHDKSMGKIAHIRLFSGQIRNRETIELKNGQTGEIKREKITRIRRMSAAARTYDAGFLPGGDVAEVYGLSGAEVGDVIGAVSRKQALNATPLFSVRVTDGNDNPTSLLTAIRELTEEDPLLQYEWKPETRELAVRIIGPIQIETLLYFLKERYDISATFSSPTVIYKETPLHAGVGYEAYTMPKPCWAIVELSIEPLPPGTGYQFCSVVKEQIPYKYQEHIKTSLLEAMKQGIYGWEVTDLRIILTGGGYHHIHTHPLDFFVATPMAFMNGMVSCESRLLEPFHKVRIAADEGLAGKLIGDILAMRGEFDSPVVTEGQVEIEAFLPVSESMDYPARLAAMTSGRGRYFSKFDGYRPCPLEFGRTTPYRGISPLDRAKWILHKRGAL